MPTNALALQIDTDLLKPIIAAVVEEVLAKIDGDQSKLHNGKLAYSEEEASALLSLRPHQLRDERLRGRVRASVGPGRRVLYQRADLLAYLAKRRWTGDK